MDTDYRFENGDKVEVPPQPPCMYCGDILHGQSYGTLKYHADKCYRVETLKVLREMKDLLDEIRTRV